MLDIPKAFFTEEIRDGYCVSEIMKRTWAAQLSLLDSLKKIFDKYGLRYFADYGTLLGAVRHKGYVPWDDDLDISMPRPDFMKLLEHADEIDEGLVIRSVYNSETYMNINAVVTHKVDTLKWDDERTDRYYGCPFICYVDIFPWDYVPRDEEKFALQRQLFSLAYKLMYDLRNIESVVFGGKTVSLRQLDRTEFRKYKSIQEFINGCKELDSLLKRNLTGLQIDREGKLRQQLCIIADTVAQMCSEEEADFVEYFPVYSDGKAYPPRREKMWQETSVELPFEFASIMVPKEYIKIVESKYGLEYQKPVFYASAHYYPFFRDEVRVLIGGDTGEMLTDSPPSDPSVEAIPEEFRTYLLREDGNLKKIILCGLSATDVINKGKPGLDSVISYLDEQEKNKDVIVFLFTAPGMVDFMDKCHLKIRQDYDRAVDQIGGMRNVIMDDNPSTGMLWALISICDEYRGNECRLAEICRKYEVPVEMF